MQFQTFGLNETNPELSPEILGGKGAGLVWLASEGVSVPPGFVIPTTVWASWQKKPKTTMKAIAAELPAYLDQLKAHFGYMPLLSVRSGARVSCPGMMDTILNVGLDESTQDEWVQRLGPSCYGDSLYRLVTMYGSVVKGIRREELEPNLSAALSAYTRAHGEFPSAMAQLLGSIEAVFKSWDNERAKVYRKLNKIPREWGTAVTVQAMVFGNANDQSCTGVLFTRNPDTGECKVTGEFLPNAQGEDIVAGVRTPQPLASMKGWNAEVYDQLIDTVLHLEKLRRDVQDVEFTVQDGTLYILQTRNAKRSATAAIRVAIDMEVTGLITKKEAVSRVSIKQFDQAQAAHLDPTFTKTASFAGIAACSGVVSGVPVFTADEALASKVPCILITHETTPNDIAGMYAAVGVITMVGGLTSHAAVVARSMDRACIVGVGQSVDAFKDVETISMDGATGRIWTEQIPIVKGETNGLIAAFARLVFDTLGAVPVITSVPVVKMPEAVLYLGDQVLYPEQAIQTVVQTLAMVDHLYLDLHVGSGPEAEFFTLIKEFKPFHQIVAGLHSLADKDRLTIIGAEFTHSFQTLGVASDLRSLVLATHGILLSTDVDQKDPATAKVMAWKQAEGVPMVSMGKYLPQTKSMISIQQALQELST